LTEKTPRRPLEKRSLLRDEIRDVIQQAILSKELKPGDRIVETQWAADLGVSKAPVREAIRELEAIGLLENKPFQGSYVRIITAKEFDDAIKVRVVLEVLGMRQAAKRITNQQLNELCDVLKEMEDAAHNQMFELYVQKNTDFHRKIIESADNVMLLNAWRQSNISEWTSIITKMSERTLENLAIRHEEMYESLLAHDEERAVKAVTVHHMELIDESIEKREKIYKDSE